MMPYRGLEQQSYSYKASPYSSHSQVLSLFPATKNAESILDVGCWDGFLGRQLHERGYQVTGVDAVKVGPPLPPGMQFVQANLHEGMPDLPGNYQKILCADVLEHLLHPDQVLRQCRQLLAPEGRLVASLPNSGHLYFRLVVLLGSFPKQEKGLFDRTHLHFFTWDGWLTLFEEAGYTVEMVRPTGVPVGLALQSNGGFAQAMEWFSFQLARCWKRLFAYQFIVQLRPKKA
jgi:SAM-dependent methyltransferase